MALPIYSGCNDQNFSLLQTNWAAVLNPIITNVNQVQNDYFVFVGNANATTGISDSTYTDITNCYLSNLPSGKYLINFGCEFEVPYSSVPNFAAKGT